MSKNITILGSTGSIGQSALEVVRQSAGQLKVFGLSANNNVEVLLKQIGEFEPEVVMVSDPVAWRKLNKLDLGRTRLVKSENVEELYGELVSIILVAISGIAALEPLVRAIRAGKDIALANKEAMVCAGQIINELAEENKVKILPVDSEHSAIWQCIGNNPKKTIRRIYLTASGGPFLNLDQSKFKQITPEQALRHPKWNMGRKISIDSATMMNKGLEVIEAMNLFGVNIDQIEIIVHPESIVHSMVEFIDGSVVAQMGPTDMKLPIQKALFYPEMHDSTVGYVDFNRTANLSFQRPNFEKFSCLMSAYNAAKIAGTMPCVLNSSNEVAVEKFLSGEIRFDQIPIIVEKVSASHKVIHNFQLEDVIDANEWAKNAALSAILEL